MRLSSDVSQLPSVDLGGQVARARVFALLPALGDLQRQLEDTVNRGLGLNPLIREIAVLTVARRSVYLMHHRRRLALDAGLTPDMIEAIEAEDYIHSGFGESQKAAFRFALMYDAGHGIGESIFSNLRAYFGPAEIVAMCALLSTWAGITRMAIALELAPQDDSAG